MLGRHLMRMQKILPKEYDFFPTSYMLPHDYKDFYEEMNRDSTELGKKWWGYVDRKGDRFKV